MKFVIVTGFDLGWDNVIGVFPFDQLEAVEKRFGNERRYYIQVDTFADVSEWDD